MSGKFTKKQIFMMAGAVLLVVLLIVLAVSCGSREEKAESVSVGQTQTAEGTTGSDEAVAGSTEKPQTESSQKADTPSQKGEAKEPANTVTSEAVKPSSEEKEGDHTEGTPSGIDISKEDAPYEKWLAAGMILGASMQYPDFEVEAIYITGEHALTEKAESAGACLQIKTGGESILIVSKPLEAERKEAGTIDLYTGDMGYNTFDVAAPGSVDTSAMTELLMEDLNKLISQTILPTIIEH